MRITRENQHKTGIICCVAGAVSWGLSGTCSEALFKGYAVDPIWITAVRMTIAGIILMAWIIGKKALPFSKLIRDKKSLLQLSIFSLLGLALCQFAYLNAIRWTNSGTATVLQNLSIAFIAIFVCLTTRRLPPKRIVICIILALIGVWLISTGGRLGNMQLTPEGLFWGIAAAFGAASYTLLSRQPVVRWGSIPVTGIGMLLGGCVLFVAVQAWQIPAGFDLRALLLLAVIIIVGTVGAFILFLQGINLVGPVKASLLGCLEPLTATTLSAFWLHSVFSLTDIIGFACIMITVLLIRE